MTIPGRGDLSPRRRRIRRRWASAVAVLVVLAALGYVGDKHFNGSSAVPVAAPRPCPSPHRTTLLKPGKVTVRVRNATTRGGLASRVAFALQQRGFHIRGVGNTSATVTGPATVRYSADQAVQARTLATEIAGVTLLRRPGTKLLDLDLGKSWRTLASPAAVTKARQVAEAPQPNPTCSPAPTVSTASTSRG